MNIIKKASTAITATCGSLALFANQTLAAGSGIMPADTQKPLAAAGGTLGDNITQILNYFLGMLGLVAVAMLIYAGVLMVTAQGNDDQISKAKGIITYAAIGIVVIVLSFTIVQFVANVLG